MSESLTVYLHGMAVGEVVRREDGRIVFDFDDEYVRNSNRATLSQSYLLKDGGVRGGSRATAGLVPPFFSNLLPEGRLRAYLAKTAGVNEHREFELLELLGADLPGAVTVVREDGGGNSLRSAVFDDENATPRPLRFSLAGVQLKFSAIERAAKGLTIPARGIGGDWIVKLPSAHYEHLSENEFLIMTMADRVGIDVPEMRLVPMEEIEGLPEEVIDMPEADAFVIRRFDRMGGRRFHIEDFAQATGKYPDDKYDPQLNYTHLTRLVATVCQEEDVIDFSRRLMFNALVGNGDMHLKNWSFIYPDARTPRLAPAYDYLCTSVYIRNETMALKLGSARKWQDLALDDFAAVADGAGVNRQIFEDAAVDMVTRFHDAWEDNATSLPIDDQLKLAIERQMKICPAIRSVLHQRRGGNARTTGLDRGIDR